MPIKNSGPSVIVIFIFVLYIHNGVSSNYVRDLIPGKWLSKTSFSAVKDEDSGETGGQWRDHFLQEESVH